MEIKNFDEINVSYPDCFIRAISAKTTFVIGRDKIDVLQYPIVLLPVTGSPFLPWSEIVLRPAFISDLEIAFQKIDTNGGMFYLKLIYRGRGKTHVYKELQKIFDVFGRILL